MTEHPEMNVEAFHRQMDMLRKFKRMNIRKLRKLHQAKFEGTRWYVKPRGWMSRYVLARRLFYLFCLKNYHFPKDSEVYRFFKLKAEKYLDPNNLQERRQEETTRKNLKDHHRFSKPAIKAMNENEVDRYLVALNIHIRAPLGQRKKALWEMFNAPQQDIIDTNSHSGIPKRRKRKSRIQNQHVLADLIVNNPGMNFDAFRGTYGKIMPTVTRGSFNNARSRLRKAGYEVDKLPKGPSQPALVATENGFKAARLEYEEE